MYSSDALSRSRYRERRLNNNVLNKNSAFSVEQVTAAPMADTICVPLFSRHSDLELWPFDLKTVLSVTPDMDNLFSKFKRFMIFRFRVNGGHVTDGRV